MEDVKSAMLPVLESLAKAFMSEGEPLHRFMVRGAVAKGHLVHGCDALDCSTILKNNPDCPSRVLLGPVVAQVFHAERNAAPFGVWIDLSAREAKTSSPFWRWWLEKESGFEDGHRAALVTALESHFDWCLCHPAQSQYSKERLDHHRLLAREYFER